MSNIRSQHKECLDATCKAWEVPFSAIWEVFFSKNLLRIHGTRQSMVALRLDSVPLLDRYLHNYPPSSHFTQRICANCVEGISESRKTSEPMFFFKSPVKEYGHEKLDSVNGSHCQTDSLSVPVPLHRDCDHVIKHGDSVPV